MPRSEAQSIISKKRRCLPGHSRAHKTRCTLPCPSHPVPQPSPCPGHSVHACSMQLLERTLTLMH